jgi:uncharacterized damage-inducible protein DinB
MESSMLATLYDYNAYANQLVFETAAHLTEEEFTQRSSPSRESVQVLLRHLLMTETFFLESCLERALLPELDQQVTLADLQSYQQQLAQEQLAYIQMLTDTDLQREIDFQIGPQPLHLPLWQMLIQAFVHSTHHRGELSIVLSQLGHPLPTLDIILPFVEWSGQTWPGK